MGLATYDAGASYSARTNLRTYDSLVGEAGGNRLRDAERANMRLNKHRDNPIRDEMIYVVWYAEGLTYAAAGARFGLSRTRVQQIVRSIERRNRLAADHAGGRGSEADLRREAALIS
jgi:DNA-directed RNA polymerase specialized sigma subunit